MSAREKYEISKIRTKIESFLGFVEADLFDDAVRYFREHLDKPTLYGLETSLIRAELLQKINVDRVTKEKDKCFVLYNLALSLNLTGGYPNKAVLVYDRHDKIAEKAGDVESLSKSLGHHAKALRQIGKFYQSEQIARKGLRLIRKERQLLNEAVNLYWLGMGLAHRGEAILSEIALQRSLRIFRSKFAVQSEGVVHAFLSQRALWLGLYKEALDNAERAVRIGENLKNDENHADLHGAMKILVAGLRMKGEAMIMSEINVSNRGNKINDFTLEDGEKFLMTALKYARQIEFVEEELPALRVLALSALRTKNTDEARNFLKMTWHLAERGSFLLYNADSYNILAQVEAAIGNRKKAITAARKAFNLSICDGVPFAYQRGLEDSQAIMNQLNAQAPKVPEFQLAMDDILTAEEINPDDEFSTDGDLSKFH